MGLFPGPCTGRGHCQSSEVTTGDMGAVLSLLPLSQPPGRLHSVQTSFCTVVGMAIQEDGDKTTTPAAWEWLSICYLWYSFNKEILNRLHPIPYPSCSVAQSILGPGAGENYPAAD